MEKVQPSDLATGGFVEDRPVAKEHKLRTTVVVAHGGDVSFLNTE